jgi:4-methyl-5(b-hydroxyethyl)-thiazole monophosphate biosynthesis
LVPIAEGSEEMEVVILVDVLRRAEWEVVMAAVGASPVACSRGVRLVPDMAWAETDPADFDLLVLPGGGPGTEVLARDPRVLETVRVFDAGGKGIAAICAAPLVLQEAGILDGRRITSHPSVADQLTVATYVEEAVVIDGHLVTSRGPGTAFSLALTLVRLSDGEGKARDLAKAMVLADAH